MTAGAAEVLEGMLLRGFTAVRDAGGADWGLAKAVDDGLVLGPRVLFTGVCGCCSCLFLSVCALHLSADLFGAWVCHLAL